MRLVILLTVTALFSVAIRTCEAVPQGVPCNCHSCQTHGCNYQGHARGCCCKALVSQAPNPLAPGRPSPPPCCADGYAYANYVTWGFYGTRWRHWPIQYAAATPGTTPSPQQLGPDVPPYQLLPPEEEDRRAPPPSAPRDGQAPVPPQRPEEDENTEAGPARPGAPTNGGSTPPSLDTLFGPSEDGLPPLPKSGDETPGTVPLTPPQGTEDTPNMLPLPTSGASDDQDAPPTPPFATPALKGPVMRSASQPIQAAPKQETRAVPQEDPPPALPKTLASALR